MSETTPIARSPVTGTAPVGDGDTSLVDMSQTLKWRLFDGEPAGVAEVTPGTSRRIDDRLVWSVSPSEWTLVGPHPDVADVVDLTHVRAMFRLTGEDAARVLAKICALDLDDAMFPSDAAARTLVAGVATEIVRDDRATTRSYLLLPSRSFGHYLYEAVLDAGEEFGLAETAG